MLAYHDIVPFDHDNLAVELQDPVASTSHSSAAQHHITADTRRSRYKRAVDLQDCNADEFGHQCAGGIHLLEVHRFAWPGMPPQCSEAKAMLHAKRAAETGRLHNTHSISSGKGVVHLHIRSTRESSRSLQRPVSTPHIGCACTGRGMQSILEPKHR